MSFKKNKEILSAILPKLQAEGIQNIINGKSVAAKSKNTFENHSPVDGKFIANVAKSDATDINAAAKAAAADASIEAKTCATSGKVSYVRKPLALSLERQA